METDNTLTLITLNTWGGRSLYPLSRFVRDHASSTDVFCLQEVFNTSQEITDARHPGQYLRGNLYTELVSWLPDHVGAFATHADDPYRMSLAMFVRKSLLLSSSINHFPVYVPERPVELGDKVFSARQIQYATIRHNGHDVLIANFHGLFDAGPKIDTPERIEQSRRVRDFMDRHDGAKVLCGDFNLLPKTESFAALAENMQDLVGERQVPGTRTQFYRHFHNADEPNFADYVLCSPELRVEHFEVLPDLVSDHTPLLVTFR